jgi:hypothetical protein
VALLFIVYSGYWFDLAGGGWRRGSESKGFAFYLRLFYALGISLLSPHRIAISNRVTNLTGSIFLFFKLFDQFYG